MLESYWPSQTQINACIKNEAETADVSVLLAVHQPSPLSVRQAGGDSDVSATETQLLEALLSDDVPSGALVVPIEGPSGAGKSHMIRWLDAQLHRSPKRDRLHIIRIPKSASLRRVVELILAPLENDERYAKARQEVSRAVEDVDKKDAVVLFRAQLETALGRKRQDLAAELRANPDRGHLKPLLGHASSLPRLFSDAALEEHFAANVLERIVARAVDGRPEEADETPPQFEADDLLAPETVDLNRAADAVRVYYTTQIAGADPARRQAAVDLLNSVVDQAIGNVFRLQQSAGGMSLQDIILAVRQILLEDDKDLVLLVEDFAALAGIQDVLLKVCIQEGVHNGRKIRATMRTAMALTDGYLVSRDTILTRAQRVWAVGRRPLSDEQVKHALIGMAGAYLNAARWGDVELAKRFGKIEPDQGLTGWLGTWEDEGRSDEEVEALDAFGVSPAGHPLFPFNRQALEQLAERHLKSGGSLTLNPRRVINEILRNTLLLRPTFAARNFPPAGFHGVVANGFLASWVSELAQPDALKRRLDSTLAVWGGQPSNEAALSELAPTVLTAFGLPSLSELAKVEYRPKKSPDDGASAGEGELGGEQGAPPPTTQDETLSEDPWITAWRNKLDAWSAGEPLNQEDARELRTALATLLKSAMNWSLLRIPSQDVKATWLSIDNARNNARAGRILVVCDQHRDEDGALRAGFLGALRFGRKAKGWNYSDGDVDYVASAKIIDRLRARLTPILLDEVKEQTAALTQALTTQARIGGLQPPVKTVGAGAVLQGLFAPIAPTSMSEAHPAWRDLQQQALGFVGGQTARQALQDLLLERVGSFQGTGTKAFAVDIGRIIEGLAAEYSSGQALDNFSSDIKSQLTILAHNRIWTRIQPVIDQLKKLHRDIDELLGDDFDKATLVEDLRRVIALLTETATIPPSLSFRFGDLPSRVNAFQASPVVTLVKASAEAVAETGRDQLPKILNALGSLDHGQINQTAKFFADLDELLTKAEPTVEREERNRSQASPAVVAGEIERLIQTVKGDPEVDSAL